MTSDFTVPDDMKVHYLRRKVDELSASRDQIASGNFEMANTLAHQMKGNAASFEFPILAQLAITLETAASNENSVQTIEILNDIQKAVDGLLRRLVKNKPEA